MTKIYLRKDIKEEFPAELTEEQKADVQECVKKIFEDYEETFKALSDK